MSGKSVAEVATAHSVEPATVVNALVTAGTARIDKAVAERPPRRRPRREAEGPASAARGSGSSTSSAARATSPRPWPRRSCTPQGTCEPRSVRRDLRVPPHFAFCAGRRRELHGHRVVRARERGRHDLRVGSRREAHVGKPAKQLLEHHLDLQARERRAEAEVRYRTRSATCRLCARVTSKRSGSSNTRSSRFADAYMRSNSSPALISTPCSS